MEDDQNVRRPKWKTTKMEDDQNGRRPKWKVIKTEYEEDLTRKQKQSQKGQFCILSLRDFCINLKPI